MNATKLSNFFALLFSLFLFTNNILAQVYTERIIATGAGKITNIVTGDINGDGHPDFVVEKTNGNDINWWKNDGTSNPSFTVNTVTTNTNDPQTIRIVDLDGDNDNDIVVSDIEHNNITWHRNSGGLNPTFHRLNVFSPYHDSFGMDVGDFNGDDIIDIAGSARGAHDIDVFKNGGGATPTWSKVSVETSLEGVIDLVVADLNGDDDLDIAAVSRGSVKEIIWYKHNGNTTPTFTKIVIEGITGIANDLFARDIDSDGDVDLILLTNLNQLLVYENSGGLNPTFTSTQLTPSFNIQFDLSIGDVNNDNHPDILTTGSNNKVNFYINDGNQPAGFTHFQEEVSGGSLYTDIADADGDGDNDIFISSWNNSTAMYLEQQDPPEIELTGNNMDIADDSTMPLISNDTDFGDVELGLSHTHTFTIKNVGEADLNLTDHPNAVSISGDADFSVTIQPSTGSLGENETTTFQVTFSPKLTGTRIATISIANNDPDEAPFNFVIEGNGTCPMSTTVLYVDELANGNSNGTSWTNAFNHLQYAISIANGCSNISQIWVATGTYLPSQEEDGSTDTQREFTFHFENDIEIYGGFPSTGTATMSDRDWELYPTTLSGDFYGDDNSDDFANHTENAQTVISTKNVSTAFVLDGFIISGGNSDDDMGAINSPASSGGAWYNLCDSGGISCNPTIRNCSFSNNYAAITGGGLFNIANHNNECSPQITACNFNHNFSGVGGGAIFYFAIFGDCYSSIKGCTFTNNSALSGGAILNLAFQGESAPVFTNCSFYDNQGEYGGAVNNQNSNGGASFIFMNCSFYNNQASEKGGAIFYNSKLNGQNDGTITNCIFWNNPAPIGNSIFTPESTNIQISHTLLEEASCIANANCGNGMLYAIDPLFTDPANGDLSIQECSPTADAGTNTGAPSDDIDGNFRPVNATGIVSALTDMGAYEYQSSFPIVSANCQAVSHNLDANGSTITVNANEINNGSTGCGSLTFLIDGLVSKDFDCNNTGSNNVTLSVTDALDRSSTCMTTVTINDNIDPSFTCLSGNQAKNTDNGLCTYTVQNTEFDPTNPSDNCGVQSITNDFNNSNSLANAVFSQGSTLVTWTITDVNNRTNNCSYTVVVNDNQDPTFSCLSGNQSKNTDNGVCTYTVQGTEFDPTSQADNCAVQSITNDFNNASSLANASFNEGSTLITWTITDVNNRTSNCSYTVVVDDNQDPTFSCLSSNQSKNTDNGVCTYTVQGTEFDPTSQADNCSVQSISNDFNNASSLANAIFNEGSTLVTWTITDVNNRTNNCSYTVVVNDNQDPTFSCLSGNQSKNTDNGVCTYTVQGTEFDPTSQADNCSVQSISNDFNNASSLANAIFNEGSTLITWTITDVNNRTSNCSYTVVVDDNQDPTFSCLSSNQSKNTDNGVCTYTVQGTEFDPTSQADNCSVQSISNDFNNASSLANAIFNEGSTLVTWTITDVNNRTNNCSYNVVVNDNQDPTFHCLSGNQSKNTDNGVCTYTVQGTEFDPTVQADNCAVQSITNDFNNANSLANAVFNEGSTLVTWTITDVNNRTNNCSYTIVVNDNQDPTFSCLSGNQSKNTDNGVCTYTVQGIEFDPTSQADNCAVQSITNDFNNANSLANAVFSEGSTLVTWTITDVNNRTNNCSYTVVVDDNQDPTFSCLSGNQSKNTDNGVCTYTVQGTEFDPTNLDDNCSVSEMINDYNNSNSLNSAVFNEGTTLVTWTIFDSSGNTSQCAFDIKVNDDEDPKISCQDHSLQLDASGNAIITAFDVLASGTDNCNVPTYSLSQYSFTCSHVGDNLVQLTADDGNGNTSSCNATVTVISNAEISISDVSKSEGSTGGNTIFIFELHRSIEGCPISVDYSTADNTATEVNNDYVSKSGTVSFSATGSNKKYVAIQVPHDTEVELNESFFVNLTNPSSTAQITDGQGEGTILNDDGATINIDDVVVNESTSTATFTVTLTQALDGGFSVDYSTVDDTAQDENGDNDYASANGTLNFVGNAGEQQTISVSIQNDNVVELDEIFFVNLNNLQSGGLNVSLGDIQGQGTIQNDDSATLFINSISKAEGDNGSTDYSFDVSLTGNVDAAFTTDWQTQDNTATNLNNDYASANGTLNFAGNDNENQTLTVQVNGDCAVESDESFFINLLNIQAGGRSISFSNAIGTGTIQNDDSNPNINNCPSNMTVDADNSCAYKLESYINTPTTSGGCGLISISQSPVIGTSIGLGINTITLTATDVSGNAASCSFDIEVIDNTAPTALCNNLTVWLNPGSSVTISSTSVDGGSSDNCNLSNLSLDQSSFDCSQIGANTVTLTATDALGLQSSCTATITVIGITVTCYLDADNDGYGDAANTQTFCLSCETGYVENDEDCDDSIANLNPNTAEICDGIDNNCDGNIDEGFDIDGDGFTTCQGDCDDNDATAFPSNPEICGDGIDNNCDGQIDEGCNPDNDFDGYTVAQGDCNDNDITIFPGAPEICDGVDNNCDGNIDEGFDLDSDGFTTCSGDCDDSNAAIFPGNVETCDGIDNNCDGQIDEGLSGETFVGDVFLFSQADVDNFLSCIGTIDGDLVINGIGIIDLSALLGLTNITGNLLISQTSLNSFFGLNNLSSIGGNLNILFNTTLADCCPIEPLISSGNISGIVFFYGNATGCESQIAITTVCNALPLISNPNTNNIPAQSTTNFEIHEQFFISEVYPNPATNVINILIGGKLESGIIRMMDMQGKIVKTQSIDTFSIEQKLEVGDLQSGIYMLTIQVNGNLQNKKVFIE